jgi:hypothetical protein
MRSPTAGRLTSGCCSYGCCSTPASHSASATPLSAGVVLAVTGLMVAVLAVFAWQSAGTGSPWSGLAVAVILGGAISNLADRAADGVVTDYLHTGWFPTFNGADVFITGWRGRAAAHRDASGNKGHTGHRLMRGCTVTTQPEEVLVRRGLALAWFIVLWDVIEGVVAVTAGLAANSIALIGFGIDSAIEVFAASVVIWQLRGGAQTRQQLALRLIGLTFFALASYVAFESIRDLITQDKAGESLAQRGRPDRHGACRRCTAPHRTGPGQPAAGGAVHRDLDIQRPIGDRVRRTRP